MAAQRSGSLRTEPNAGSWSAQDVLIIEGIVTLLPTSTGADIDERQPSVAVLLVGAFEQQGRYPESRLIGHPSYAAAA